MVFRMWGGGPPPSHGASELRTVAHASGSVPSVVDGGPPYAQGVPPGLNPRHLGGARWRRSCEGLRRND